MPGSCDTTRNGDVNRIESSYTRVPSLVFFALGCASFLASGHGSLTESGEWKRIQLAALALSPVHLPAGRAVSHTVLKVIHA